MIDIQYRNFQMKKVVRENNSPNQKLTCFVLYLKIINTFKINNIGLCIL